MLTMSRIVVAGGGIVGLSMAMMLAKQGHEVTVLERDAGAVPRSPDEAWQAWERQGIAQFRQAHFMHAAGRQLLDAMLPACKAATPAAPSACGSRPTGSPDSSASASPAPVSISAGPPAVCTSSG